MIRRATGVLALTLITAGIVIGVDVGMTLAWKEPVSAIYGSIQQDKAEDSLAELTQTFGALPEARAAADEPDPQARVEKLARVFAETVETGEGIGRIKIPSIGLDAVFVQGTDTSSLQMGPGHYPDTAFPGQGRTIGIAGHRTTYLAPFRNINEVADGDEVIVEMPYGTFTYTVRKHEIVDPSQVEIVEDVGYEQLVLTACHPLYSAAQRWAVFGRLREVSVNTGARESPSSPLGVLPGDVVDAPDRRRAQGYG